MSAAKPQPLSPLMRDTIEAMRAGTVYLDDWTGVIRLNASASAPQPSITTLEALERRGLVRHLTPREHGVPRPRWELMERLTETESAPKPQEDWEALCRSIGRSCPAVIEGDPSTCPLDDCPMSDPDRLVEEAALSDPKPLEGVGDSVESALAWALDIIDMYDARLVELGDPPELVRSEVHLAGKARARGLLKSSAANARELADALEALRSHPVVAGLRARIRDDSLRDGVPNPIELADVSPHEGRETPVSAPRPRIMDLGILRRLAEIFGPESASGMALADWERRLAPGQEPIVVEAGDSLLVVNRQALEGEKP
jgi:hypothetical protein